MSRAASIPGSPDRQSTSWTKRFVGSTPPRLSARLFARRRRDGGAFPRMIGRRRRSVRRSVGHPSWAHLAGVLRRATGRVTTDAPSVREDGTRFPSRWTVQAPQTAMVNGCDARSRLSGRWQTRPRPPEEVPLPPPPRPLRSPRPRRQRLWREARPPLPCLPAGFVDRRTASSIRRCRRRSSPTNPVTRFESGFPACEEVGKPLLPCTSRCPSKPRE